MRANQKSAKRDVYAPFPAQPTGIKGFKQRMWRAANTISWQTGKRDDRVRNKSSLIGKQALTCQDLPCCFTVLFPRGKKQRKMLMRSIMFNSLKLNSVADGLVGQVTVLGWLRQPICTSLKGSYDAFLKIIILCIWCNRICWHALMFKKTLFSNTVHYCRPSMPRLSQTLRFLQSPSFRQSTVCSDWPTGTVHCDWPNTASTSRKCNAPFHNREL